MPLARLFTDMLYNRKQPISPMLLDLAPLLKDTQFQLGRHVIVFDGEDVVEIDMLLHLDRLGRLLIPDESLEIDHQNVGKTLKDLFSVRLHGYTIFLIIIDHFLFKVAIEAFLDGAPIIRDVDIKHKRRLESYAVISAAFGKELSSGYSTKDVSDHAVLLVLIHVGVIESQLRVLLASLLPGHLAYMADSFFDFLVSFLLVGHVNTLELLVQFAEDEIEKLRTILLMLSRWIELVQFFEEDLLCVHDPCLIVAGLAARHQIDRWLEIPAQFYELDQNFFFL